MRRRHKLYFFIACLVICLVAVFVGVKCSSAPVAQKQKLAVYEISGAGSEGFSQVWEDGQAVR